MVFIPAGKSNDTGFELSAWDRKNGPVYTTPQYERDKKMDISLGLFWLHATAISVAGYLSTTFLASWLVADGAVSSWWYQILSLLSWFFAGQLWGIILIQYRNRSACQWHGCEHKTAVMLTSGKPVTMETLCASPRAVKQCGARYLTWFLINPLFLFALLLVCGGDPLPFLLTWITVSALWWENTFLLVVPDPASLFVQRFLTTAPSTDAQLADGLAVAERIVADYPASR